MVIAYTDGSAWPNPNGIGGWAVVFEDGRELSGRVDEGASNNRMEIQAVIEAICHGATVIYSDSMYVVGTLMNGWKRRANHDLWEDMDKVFGPDIALIHVKGHAGNPFNERADVLAAEARLAQ